MLNMRKLIDETDFENLNELTRQLNDPSHPLKENDSTRSNDPPQQKHPKDLKPPHRPKDPDAPQNKKRSVVPQVMDEDTEHFKNKLEHLLNNFKTDAVSEFMSMKKDMLEYQQECVKTDTQKYLTMYEEKHQELLQTKERLLSVSKEAEKKTIQVELLSEHIAKLNNQLRVTKYVSRPFSILFQNKEHGKLMKFKQNQAIKFDQKRLQRKALWGWTGLFKEHQKEQQNANSEARVEREVNEIVGRFQKEMELLKERLAEATRKNEQYENNKYMMKENLQKAFLRGVSAMNMEAMGLLGTQNAEECEWASEKEVAKTENERSFFANNLSFVDQRASREETTQNQSMLISKTQTNSKPPSAQYTGRKNDVAIINPPKAESKNHKWKEAPIMGVQERGEIEEPRMQIVRPTTEGKVIKVVDGRSAVETGVGRPSEAKKGMGSDRFSVASSSRKKI